MSQSLIVDISFEDEASEDIIVALKDIGGENVQQVRQRGFTGIETVIAAVLVVTALADLVIRLSRLWKCGIIVDARGSRILTKKDCDLPRGSVLIIAPDGTETKLNEPSQGEIDKLLSKLVEGQP